MSQGKVLALVPARGGSKRVPLKNFKKLAGRTLLERTVEPALQCAEIDLVVVSTDREDLAQESLKPSAKLKIQKRSAKAADDHATAFDVIEEVLRENPGFEYLIYLQPTSPLRTQGDIQKALALFKQGDFDNVVSVMPVKSGMLFSMKKDAKGCAEFLFPESLQKRSQDLPPLFTLNGAIYVTKIENLNNDKSFFSGRVGTYEMTEAQSIDIDDENDWREAEKALSSEAKR